MEFKYKILAVIIVLVILYIAKLINDKNTKTDNFKNNKRKKPYRKNTKKSNNVQDDMDTLADELYTEFHELFMEEDTIDEDDLMEFDERLDDVILIEFTQLYNNKEHSKIKTRDYKKILKKNLNND